jgi:hypothetical protein
VACRLSRTRAITAGGSAEISIALFGVVNISGGQSGQSLSCAAHTPLAATHRTRFGKRPRGIEGTSGRAEEVDNGSTRLRRSGQRRPSKESQRW